MENISTRVQEWVIWGLDKKGEILFNKRTVIKPSRTKEYKSLEKDFNKGLLSKFGFMSHKEYVKQNYWLDSSNQFKELG